MAEKIYDDDFVQESDSKTPKHLRTIPSDYETTKF